MLDFRKLMVQIEQVGSDSFDDTLSARNALENGKKVFSEAIQSQEAFVQRLQADMGWTLWPVALPLEDLLQADVVPLCRDPVTVVGVDGSQIMPSHHEVHNCFLLNIGSAVITYGAKQPALLESEPRLYHRPEDLYPLVDRRRLHIDELYVSLERMLLEFDTLVTLSLRAQQRGVPVIALVDGSLIPWSLEKMPDSYQDLYLQRMSSAIEELQMASIPLIGYLSHSRSSDVVNDLRVFACPYDSSHCRDYCGDINEEDFPCSSIWPLTDRQLMARSLNFGQRTGSFLSGASVAKRLAADHRVCFCYLHVGKEITRLEFPRWLLGDRTLFHLALSAVLSQVDKGMGYPVCLAEAHHLAVIRGPDRQRFFELITRQLVSVGVSTVKLSPKESRKRTSFI
ncbi:MAG TPA: DNA double-strand break repair nuclease NurA [Candidatus Obscuribacterales bacterium]